MTEIADQLTEFGIAFREFRMEHLSFPLPVSYWSERHLQRCKNLFFRDNHGKNHFFVVLDFYRELNIDILKKLTGHNTLSFASPSRLKRFLGQEPGAVSVLGLVNDTESGVKVFLDENLEKDELLTFRSGKKNELIGLSFSALKQFLRITNHEFQVAELYNDHP